MTIWAVRRAVKGFWMAWRGWWGQESDAEQAKDREIQYETKTWG